MQTLITSNNKESDKLRNLKVLHYYNALEWGYKFVNEGRKAINPNYLLQTMYINNNKTQKCKDEEKRK